MDAVLKVYDAFDKLDDIFEDINGCPLSSGKFEDIGLIFEVIIAECDKTWFKEDGDISDEAYAIIWDREGDVSERSELLLNKEMII